MIKSINSWSLPGNLTPVEALLAAKRAGFDGFEPAFTLEGELSLASHTSGAKQLLKTAESEGIKIVSLAAGLYWEHSFTSNDPAVRAKAADISRAQLDCAAELGVNCILVVPGGVNPEVSYDVAYDRALEGINSVKDYAKKVGVVIGLENVWNNFLLSPLEMRDFIDKLDSEWVGAYFDAGNVLRTGFPQHWIRILGKRIKKVHIKDFHTNIGNWQGFCSLLEGDVPFKEVMTALREVGYDDAIIAEVGCSSIAPDLFPRHTSLAMDAILAM